MAKRVMLAVAGAGKTYHICHTIDPAKRNLILAFTHENVHNIQRELHDAYGHIPKSTVVSTFDAFVYHEMILPYEPSIASYFKQPNFISQGICTKDPPSRVIHTKSGKTIPNPDYKKKSELGHYVTQNGHYYCSTLSELVLQVKGECGKLVQRVVNRLNKFYDCILIDEFQDFREHDYNLILTLAKGLNDLLLVGDYYQHSVSAKKNDGKPFESRGKDVSYSKFVEGLLQSGFSVDTSTLAKSRRCSAEVCAYVSRKLGIQIESHDNHAGRVIFVDDKNISRILEDSTILKLVYKEVDSYRFNAMNWSYSKGDTVDCACVILTESFEALDAETFETHKISQSTINKLYVAMTRSKGDLYLIRKSAFNCIEAQYRKQS